MVNLVTKIAILGGGAGGLGCACDLSILGHSVNLFELPRFKAPHIDAVQKRGGIEVDGLRKGMVRLNIVTTGVREALEGVEVILIITPAYGTGIFCKTCIPHMEDGQIIIFHGKGGHTLEFVKVAEELGVKKKVFLGETNTLPIGARLTGPGKVTIYSRIRVLYSSAFPTKNTEKIVTTLKELYPSTPPYRYKILPAENVLSVILCDLNAISHPQKIIFNLSRIDSQRRDFRIYLEGDSPSILKIEEALEKERLAVMADFGLKPIPAAKIRSPEELRTKKELELRKAFREDVTVFSTKERYISEDVPYGLVTISSLANVVGTKTPLIDSLVNISNIVNGIDYWKMGRTVEKLGLMGLDANGILSFLKNG